MVLNQGSALHSPQINLVKSGDICRLSTSGTERCRHLTDDRDAAKHPAMNNTVPTTMSYQQRLGNPSLDNVLLEQS